MRCDGTTVRRATVDCDGPIARCDGPLSIDSNAGTSHHRTGPTHLAPTFAPSHHLALAPQVARW